MAKTFMQMVQEAQSEVGSISPQDAQRLMQEQPDALVVDVREPDGIAEQGGVPGAKNVPLGMLAIKADQELPEEMRDADLQDRSRTVITTCALGGQASLAAKTLKDMGFTNVRYLEGGFNGWQDAGLPVQSAESAHTPPTSGTTPDAAGALESPTQQQ